MKVVEIDVEALPYFESDHKGPMDVIRAPGEDVTIRCQPQGVPKPEVEWRINGKPLNGNLFAVVAFLSKIKTWVLQPCLLLFFFLVIPLLLPRSLPFSCTVVIFS